MNEARIYSKLFPFNLQGDENGLDYPLNEPPYEQGAVSGGDDYFYPSSDDGSEYQDLDLTAVSGLV